MRTSILFREAMPIGGLVAGRQHDDSASMKTPNPSRMLCALLTLSIVFLLHSAHAATISVHVGAAGGTTFTPDPVFIAPGDTVEWTWDFGGHSVTSGTPAVPDGMFDSGLQAAGFIFSFTFPSAGTFPYFCTRHGAMMTGTVNVVDASPTPSPTPSTTPNPTATATATIAPSPTPSTTPDITISGTVSYCSNPVCACGIRCVDEPDWFHTSANFDADRRLGQLLF